LCKFRGAIVNNQFRGYFQGFLRFDFHVAAKRDDVGIRIIDGAMTSNLIGFFDSSRIDCEINLF